MPKKYRLSRAELGSLSKGKVLRAHGSFFSITIAHLPPGGYPKMACVVSKKIAAHAVDRNRVQRRCREIVRPHLSRIKDPLALVFYAKRGAAAASFADFKKEIERLLSRVPGLA